MSGKRRVKLPQTASKGQVIKIKTIASHPMESGFRKGKDGKLIPRNIINKFICRFDGRDITVIDLHPSVSSNPFLAFSARVHKSGTFEFEWIEDGGASTKLTKTIKVT